MKAKVLAILIIGAFGVSVFTSCEKNDPDQWLKDNVTVVGKIPVISSITVVPPKTASVTAGESITLDLRYWSEEAIDKINLSS